MYASAWPCQTVLLYCDIHVTFQHKSLFQTSASTGIAQLVGIGNLSCVWALGYMISTLSQAPLSKHAYHGFGLHFLILLQAENGMQAAAAAPDKPANKQALSEVYTY